MVNERQFYICQSQDINHFYDTGRALRAAGQKYGVWTKLSKQRNVLKYVTQQKINYSILRKDVLPVPFLPDLVGDNWEEDLLVCKVHHDRA